MTLRFIFLLIFSLFLLSVHGQEMIFCERVEKDGKPIEPSSLFNISKKGGILYLLVKLPTKFQSKSVLIDIYSVNQETKKEVFDNSLQMEPRPGWNWFSKEMIFYKGGEYVVYVYDEKDQLLSTGKVKIVVE